jgi:hypothetical protein
MYYHPMSFDAAIAALRTRIEADIGERDVAYIERVAQASRWLQRIGRGWSITSGGLLGFAGGVTCLWIGKQLERTELYNAAVSGAYDRLHDAADYHASEWRIRSDEGRIAKAFRLVRPLSREFVVLPALAGPLWWKAVLGSALSEIMRELFTAALSARDQTNVLVPLPVSILCGGADLATCRALFPTLPPHRLREIAPEVRRLCEQHGVAYPIDGWTTTVRKVFRQLRRGDTGERRGIVRAA